MGCWTTILSFSRDELQERMYASFWSRWTWTPRWRKMYPHELSGGMKQRVCVAMAISMEPKLIIADEPTSALDVVIQRQVMETIDRLQEEIGSVDDPDRARYGADGPVCGPLGGDVRGQADGDWGHRGHVSPSRCIPTRSC